MVDDHAYADPLDDRGRERLDLAAEDLDLGLAGAHDVGLDLFARRAGRARAIATAAILERVGRAHAAVPPTVISRTSTVG